MLTTRTSRMSLTTTPRDGAKSRPRGVRAALDDARRMLVTAPEGRRVPGTVPALLLGLLAGALATAYAARAGTLLGHGDGIAHLVAARRVVDARTPGFGQVGTQWLPLPDLLLVPFAAVGPLFRTGLAGCLLGTLSLGVAAAATHRTTARLGLGAAARATALAVLVTSPALLLAATSALSEPVLLALTVATVAGLAGWADPGTRRGPGDLAVLAGAPAAAAVLSGWTGWVLAVAGAGYVLVVARRRGLGPRGSVGLALSFAAAPAVAAAWWLVRRAVAGDAVAAPFASLATSTDDALTGGHPGLALHVLGSALLDTVGLVPLIAAAAGLGVLTLQRGLDDRALLVWVVGTPTLALLGGLVAGRVLLLDDASLPVGASGTHAALVALPWVALLCAYAVQLGEEALAHARGRGARPGLVAAGLLVLLAAQAAWWASSPADRLVLVAEVHAQQHATADAGAVGRWLADHVAPGPAGGGVLTDGTGSDRVLGPASGLPLDTFVTRSDGAEFRAALANPFTHARWVVLALEPSPDAVDSPTAGLLADPQFRARYHPVFRAGDLTVFERVGP